jgi:hypothetical protein
MTSQIELIKAHVLNRLADAAEPFVQVMVDNGTGLKEFESATFGMLLQVGLQLLKKFGKMQGDGDRGETIIDPTPAPAGAPSGERLLYRSQTRITRSIRSIFGSADFSVYVYHIKDDPNSAIAFRPFDAALQITPERYSPLLQEYSMLFCCEQSFRGAAESFEKVFGQQLSVDTLEKVSRRMGHAAAEFMHQKPAPPADEEGQFLVLTADGKGVPLVKPEALRLAAFEEKAVRPGNRRMATVCSVYSVDAFHRTAADVVAGLFRDPTDTQSSPTCRPAPQHKRLTAFLPATLPDLPDEMTRGATIAMSWAAHEIELRRKPNQILIRLMDGQHSLWSEADAALSDHDGLTVDILDIVHVAGYVAQAAKQLCCAAQRMKFIRERMQRILEGDVASVIRGFRRMSALKKLQGDRKASVEAACGYFEAHSHRMRYHEYLAAGYPIATGLIEGACRHLVKDRLECSGMRWTIKCAQAMLNLRFVKASDFWDEFQRSYHGVRAIPI